MRNKALFLSFVLLTFCAAELFSAPSLEPSILTGLDQSATAEMTSMQIVQTAIEYSLCPPGSDEERQCLEKYAALEKSVQEQLAALPKMEAAEKILALMYESVLYRYKADSTRLNTTLLTGEYNCVTASVLYLALATSLGIDARGQETTVHAFCTVYIDGQKIDVETTNPYGFNPGVKKAVGGTENSRRYAVVPRRYYSGRREISARAMATLTGKNVASDLNDAEDYETAIPLEISRLEYLSITDDSETGTAKSDLDTLVCNYAMLLSKAMRNVEALDYINQVADKFGYSAELRRTYGNVLYNEAVNLTNDRKYEEARSFFEERKDGADSTMQSRIDRMITSGSLKYHEVSVHNQVVPLFNGGSYEDAKAILEEALKQNPESSVLKRDLQQVNRALSR